MSKSAKFEVYRSKLQWRFRFKAANGKIIAWGEGYWRKRGVLNAIKVIKELATNAPIIEKYK